MKVRFIQWNVWFPEKIENIVRTLEAHNPDIVCLQELTVRSKFNPEIENTADYIQEALGFNGYYKAAQEWRNNDDIGALINGVFTRFPMVKTDFSYLLEPTSTDFKEFGYAKQGRVYVEATLKIAQTHLTAATTHLNYTHKFQETEAKNIEADNLSRAVESKKQNFVFSGDLNSPPDSYTVRQLSRHLTNAGPDYDEKTWTTKPFEDYDGFKEDQLNWRLDYVFATPDLKILSAKIIDTPYSDHLPVMVDLEI